MFKSQKYAFQNFQSQNTDCLKGQARPCLWSYTQGIHNQRTIRALYQSVLGAKDFFDIVACKEAKRFSGVKIRLQV